jgi:hypothetical protein
MFLVEIKGLSQKTPMQEKKVPFLLSCMNKAASIIKWEIVWGLSTEICRNSDCHKRVVRVGNEFGGVIIVAAFASDVAETWTMI